MLTSFTSQVAKQDPRSSLIGFFGTLLYVLLYKDYAGNLGCTITNVSVGEVLWSVYVMVVIFLIRDLLHEPPPPSEGDQKAEWAQINISFLVNCHY